MYVQSAVLRVVQCESAGTHNPARGNCTVAKYVLSFQKIHDIRVKDNLDMSDTNTHMHRVSYISNY